MITVQYYGVLKTYQHVLDVVIAVIQVGNHFSEVFQEQIFVVQELLFLYQTGVLILSDIFTLLQDCHGVVVLLTEKQDVETCFFVVLHGKRKSAFCKYRHDRRSNEGQNLYVNWLMKRKKIP